MQRGEGTETSAVEGSARIAELEAELEATRDRLSHRVHQQAAIAALGLHALEIEDLPNLFDFAALSISEYIQAEFVKILELSPGGEELIMRAGFGWREGLVGRATVPAGADSQAGFTLRAAAPVIVEDMRTESRFAGPPLLNDHGVVSGISVIIGDPYSPWGVLGAHTTARRAFTPADVDFIQGVANLLASAIGNEQAKRSLRESEDRTQFVLRGGDLGTWDWDLVTGELTHNERWADMLGYELDGLDAELTSWKSLAHPDDEPRVMEELQAHLDGKTDHYETEHRIKHKSGDWIWVLDKGRVIERDTGGRPLRACGTHLDITERKNSEQQLLVAKSRVEEAHQELQEAHAQTEQLLESISSILISTDADGRVLTWSRVAEQTLEFSSGQAVGRKLQDLEIEWDGAAIAAGLVECGEKRRAARIDDVRFTRSDGSERCLGFTANPIGLDPEGTRGCLLNGADITKRKAFEQQLNQAQKMESIGQLAAGIAHEINTPTQYVGDNTRFLQESFEELSPILEKLGELTGAVRSGTALPELADEVEAAVERADLDYLKEEIPRAIGQSIEGVGRVSEIVKAMKEFSHPGGKDKQAIDINRAIESTVTVARNEWKYVADLTTEFDAGLPLVPCLPGDFNQVILNIVVNAAHAIGDVVGDGGEGKGTIAVSTHEVDDWAEIRITDSGSGIPEEIQKKIFDPFFTTKDVGKGTGQGLGIAHAVISKKHGGTIAVDSEIGRGTTFIIRLPLIDPAEKSGQAAVVEEVPA